MNQVAQGVLWAGIVVALAWQAGSQDTWLVRFLAPFLPVPQIAPDGQDVTLSHTEVGLALQGRLWRRGERLESLSPTQQAEARNATIRDLVDQKLLRSARGPEGELVARREVQNELSQFARMLAFEKGRSDAALKKGLHKESSFERWVHNLLLDELWLDQRLASPPTPAAVRDWYEAHKENLRVPRTYQAAHLFLSRHEPGKPDRSSEMLRLSARLADGADWFGLVSEWSEDERTRHRGGVLGWATPPRMPAEFMRPLEQMRPAQISLLVETRLGWHIIKLIESKPTHVPPLADVTAEIGAMLGHRQQRNAIKRSGGIRAMLLRPVAAQ